MLEVGYNFTSPMGVGFPAGGADPDHHTPRAGFPRPRTTTTAPPAHSLSLMP